jgi:hypothetical protein
MQADAPQKGRTSQQYQYETIGTPIEKALIQFYARQKIDVKHKFE